MNTRYEELKLAFCEKYLAWTNTQWGTWAAREEAWAEYIRARDMWLNVGRPSDYYEERDDD